MLWFRGLVLWMVAGVLSACGGGGGGGDSGTDNSGPAVRADTAPIVQTKRVDEPIEAVSFRVDAVNVPAGQLVWGAVSTQGLAVGSADFVALSTRSVDLNIYPRQAGELAPGTYTGSVRFDICMDEFCAQPLRNSPVHISVELAVVGVPPVGVTVTPSAIEVSAYTGFDAGPYATVDMTLERALDVLPHVVLGPSQSFYEISMTSMDSWRHVGLDIDFPNPQTLTPGSYADTLTVRFCYAEGCLNEITATPVEIPIGYTVHPPGVRPEAGIDPLVPISQIVLSHNVVDAEYSKTLDSIVMVASYPSNALYAYDIGSGSEQVLALEAVPQAVSVGPSGLEAVVAHDGSLTHVNLSQLGMPGASPAKTLSLSTDAGDVVLDGRGYAHAFPASNDPAYLHSVEIATNTEVLGSGTFYFGERAKLHSSGGYIYAATNGLSPDEIEKFDIAVIPATYLYDSVYHGEHDFCGDLWLGEDGSDIFTACGNVLRASVNPDEDMRYVAALPLLDPPIRFSVIRSLSEAVSRGEIAVLEEFFSDCDRFGTQLLSCYTHVSLFDRQTFERTALFTLPPITIDHVSYGQLGLFVFHGADGARRFIVSRLHLLPDPDAEYLLSEF